MSTCERKKNGNQYEELPLFVGKSNGIHRKMQAERWNRGRAEGRARGRPRESLLSLAGW